MQHLVDADTLCFAAASMAEEIDETQARWNVDQGLASLLARLNSTDYKLYLTGENNFRYHVFPEYKANRAKQPRPKYLKLCKEHLVTEYGAIMSDGCEADDLCGIAQCTAEHETMIVSIDKDLNMIPGWHYSPAISRNGVVTREEQTYLVSPTDARRFFYNQLLVGDATDGIKGAPGIGKVKAGKILADLETEKDLYEAVQSYFSCDEELVMNAQVLWIWRKPNDIWQPPVFAEDTDGD